MKKLLFLISLTLIFGCTSTTHITKMEDVSTTEANLNKEDVVIFRQNQVVSKPYQILGKVFKERRQATIFGNPSEEDVIEQLREPAAKMGADAIVGAYSSKWVGDVMAERRDARWASALAVKFVKDTIETKKPDFVVVILPTIFRTEKDSTIQLFDDWIIRSLAQYNLEKNGYYAFLTHRALSFEDIQERDASLIENIEKAYEDLQDKVQAMDDSVRNKIEAVDSTLSERIESKGLLVKNTSFVLVLTLESSTEKKDKWILASKKTTISGILLSAESGQIVWKNTFAGKKKKRGLIPLYDDPNSLATYEAIKGLLKTLSPKYTEISRPRSTRK